MKWTWSSALSLNRFSICSASFSMSNSSSTSVASGSIFSLRLSLCWWRLRFPGEANSSPSLDGGSAIAPSAAILATSSSLRDVFNASLSASTISLCCLNLSNSSRKSTIWHSAVNLSCSFAASFLLCTSTSSLINVYLFLADFSSSCSFTNALEDLNASFLALRTSFS